MKIVVFGATGPTGQRLVLEALNADHVVLAIARTESIAKLLPEIVHHPNFGTVNVSIFSAASMLPFMQDADAVVSCLGVYPSLKWLPFRHLNFYYPSMKAIISAMKQAKVRRLVVMSVWCTEYKKSYPLYAKLFWTYLLGRLTNDFRDMELLIESESAYIDPTIVRPCILTPKSKVDLRGENEKKDDPIDAVEGGFIVPGKKFRQANISRSMVVSFMLKCLVDKKTVGKAYAICRSSQ
uniref:NAD(P)-binding domain-containing protein n=1 Tax=Plectus sambesii TaxID=2011161 RepID=A0A914WCH0_9BILA